MNSAMSPRRRTALLSSRTIVLLILPLILSSFSLAATPVLAAQVSVGLGSYNTTLPGGITGQAPFQPGMVPSNAAAIPKKTANVTGPIPTNDWWTSIAWKRYDTGTNYSENMFPHPLGLHGNGGGLGVSYPTNPNITQGNPAHLGEYHYEYVEDLTIGVAGLSSPDMKLDGYSDWTVTAFWSGGANSLKATFGRGLPFVYATKTGGNAQVLFANTATVWAGAGTNAVGVTVNGHNYGIFSPTGSTWTQTGNVFQSTLNGNNYFSVAVLPDNTAATLAAYKQYAFSFVTNTQVSWSYNAATAKLTTNYNVTTVTKEGTQTGTMMALYRHQWLNVPGGTINTPYTYVSPRGQMKVVSGNSFSTVMSFNGVLPTLPDVGTYNRTQLFNYVNDIFLTPDLFHLQVPDDGSFRDARGTYWVGKALTRMGLLVRIADQLRVDPALTASQQTTMLNARDRFLSVMKSTMQDWFQAPDGDNNKMFYYNNTWGTLIGFPSEFGSDAELNDHDFHLGYFIQAGAIVAQYDPAWAQPSQWGGMINLLAQNVANIDTTAQPLFPRLRNFDPYAGHSWASGHAGFAAGNNQESSSEAINFDTGLILWGAATNNTALRDLGIYLYTNQVASIEQYWFDVDDQTIPSTFPHPYYAINWDNGGAYATWFSADPEKIHGINILPINGGSLYLGRRPDYFPTFYNHMTASNGGPETIWQDIIWEYQALVDPATAIGKFNAIANSYIPEEGETKAHTFHWLQNLNALGQLDTSANGNIPTSTVFMKGGVRTFVAWNPGTTSLDVTFTWPGGSACMTVPPGAVIGSKTPTCGTINPPPAPTGLTATAVSSSQINLSWNASTGATSYTVYRATTSGFTPGPGNQIASGVTATSFNDTGLAASTTYFYKVTAINSAGASPPSAQAQATTQPAGSLNTGYLSPTANGSQSGGDGNGFQTNPANAYSNNASFAVDTDSGTNTSLSCTDGGKDKHRYFNYGFPLPANATISGISVRVDAKVDNSANTPKMCVQLSWDGGTSWTTAKTTANLTTAETTHFLGSPTDTWGRTWSVANLANGSFRVRVINTASSIARDFSLDWIPVNVYYTVPTGTPPAAPTGLTATAVSSSQINLSWTASAGATSYTVYRATTSGFTPGPGNQIASGVTGTTFNNTGLAASTTYFYKVTAVNSAGESAPSAQAQATTQPGATFSPTLYVIDGATTTVNGSMASTAGAGALSDSIPSAGGGNFDGTPTNALTYISGPLNATFDATKSTAFSMYVDAGTVVAVGVQARVSYDFTGDGSWDRVETYNYFATDPVVGWELYDQTRGLKGSPTGSFANLVNGKVKIELWNAIGNGASSIRTSATTANGQQSILTIPFN